jgi:hypothetical protein
MKIFNGGRSNPVTLTNPATIYLMTEGSYAKPVVIAKLLKHEKD